MRIAQMLLMRLRALVRGDVADRELSDEMRAHLQHLVSGYVARGLTPEAARDAARREFGPLTQLAEESRDARGVGWLANGWQDIRYGARLMRRTPGFAAAAILTIALGIGATTAMFSIVYGVVLRPLPYRDPDRLVNLWSTAIKRGLPRANVCMANVYDWKARNHVFEDIAALRAVANFNLTGQGEPERLNGSRVSSNLFPVLGVTPLVGRTFTEDEDEIGHEHVALLTYPLWVRRFGADPGSSVARSR
jgi:putative ABC transport system permease protein